MPGHARKREQFVLGRGIDESALVVSAPPTRAPHLVRARRARPVYCIYLKNYREYLYNTRLWYKDCHGPEIQSKQAVEFPIAVGTRKMRILPQIETKPL